MNLHNEKELNDLLDLNAVSIQFNLNSYYPIHSKRQNYRFDIR
jgi:hypothetical protein